MLPSDPCSPLDDIQQRAIESCWEALLDDVVLDVCQMVHRHVKGRGSMHACGSKPLVCSSVPGMPHGDQETTLGGFPANAVPSGVPKATSRGVGGSVDIFGQSHPPKAVDIVTCKNCGRSVALYISRLFCKLLISS
jgi:hypothetical protein